MRAKHLEIAHDAAARDGFTLVRYVCMRDLFCRQKPALTHPPNPPTLSALRCFAPPALFFLPKGPRHGRAVVFPRGLYVVSFRGLGVGALPPARSRTTSGGK